VKIVHIVRDCIPIVASWMAVVDSHPDLMIYSPWGEKFPCLWLMPRPKDHDARERLQHHAFFFPGGGRELFIDYCNKVR
jgi:hypothetical protein